MNIGKYDCLLVRERTAYKQEQLENPQQLYELIRDKLKLFENSPVEMLYVLYLNCKMKITGYEMISKGSLTGTNAGPREILRGCMLSNAAAFVVAHNHPSNDPSPSDADIAVTKQLFDASKIMGIELVDHLIYCDDSFISLKTEGLF